jgi:SNF2 family DNA or RNA helicase
LTKVRISITSGMSLLKAKLQAHMVRSPVTTFFRAVSDLKARSRWCLTGTPIQNRLEDIGALFAFIRARPFESLAVFRRFIAIPYEESEERREVAVQNLTLLLESLCLRRTRSLLDLPESQDKVITVHLSREERLQYEKTSQMMNRALRQRVGEEFTKSKFGMFQIQLQLRILCNHGTYQPDFSWARRSLLDEREDALCSFGDRSEVRCSVCRLSIPMLGSNNMYKSYKASCMHILCSECLDDKTPPNQEEPSSCPLCAIPGVTGPKSLSFQAKALRDDYSLRRGHSSKMEALIEDVCKDIESTKRQVHVETPPPSLLPLSRHLT